MHEYIFLTFILLLAVHQLIVFTLVLLVLAVLAVFVVVVVIFVAEIFAVYSVVFVFRVFRVFVGGVVRSRANSVNKLPALP